MSRGSPSFSPWIPQIAGGEVAVLGDPFNAIALEGHDGHGDRAWPWRRPTKWARKNPGDGQHLHDVYRKLIIFDGNIHYTWPFCIAMLLYPKSFTKMVEDNDTT